MKNPMFAFVLATIIAALGPASAQTANAPASAGQAAPQKWIGLRTGPIMPMIRPHLKRQLTGLPEDAGLMIWDIASESPAVIAGIEKFDIVLRADGQPLAKPEALQEMLNKRNFGTSVRLDLLHEGQPKTVYVLVLEKPAGSPPARGPGGRGMADFFGKMQTGLTFTDPDGNQQKLSGEQIGEFMRKMREDEKYRDAILQKGISFTMKAKPQQAANE